MRDNLRLYHTMMVHISKWLPNERITRVRNLALQEYRPSFAMARQ